MCRFILALRQVYLPVIDTMAWESGTVSPGSRIWRPLESRLIANFGAPLVWAHDDCDADGDFDARESAGELIHLSEMPRLAGSVDDDQGLRGVC